MKTPGDCGGLLVSTARVNEGYSRWLEWRVRAEWFMTMGDPLAWSALVALTGHPGGYMGDVKPLHPPGFDPSLIRFEYAGKGRTAPAAPASGDAEVRILDALERDFAETHDAVMHPERFGGVFCHTQDGAGPTATEDGEGSP